MATITVTPAAGAKYTRVIIAPHAGMSLAIPQLTGADASYNPATGDVLVGAVALVKCSAGYDGLRPWAFGVSNIIDATPPGENVTASFATNYPPTLAL